MWKFIFITIPALLAACATTIQPGNPFSDSERRFFDDGLDVVENLDGIQGQFGFEEREALDARCNLSDVIAEITIVSVQDTEGVGGVAEKRIRIKVDRVIYGDMTGDELNLTSSANALGYTLLKRYETSLSGGKLLFLRTFEPAEGSEQSGHHFHLSPDSEAMKKSVVTLIDKRVEAESERRDRKRKPRKSDSD